MINKSEIMMGEEGYLFAVSGDQYVLEAIHSAKTVRKVHSDARIALVTDHKTTVPSDHIFDAVIRITLPCFSNPKLLGHAAKLLGLGNSPYQKTIFLDSDTFIIENCQELFEVLNWFDMMVCHDYHEIRWPMVQNKPLVGCNPYNSGVLAFQSNETVKKFLSEWYERFIQNYEIYQGDQPAFMEALLYVNLKTYSLQTIYNFRFNQFLTISSGLVKILHGRHPDLPLIAQRVNASTNHRCWNPKLWRCQSWQDAPSLRERLFRIKRMFAR